MFPIAPHIDEWNQLPLRSQVLFRDGQHPSGSGAGLSNALRATFGS